MPLGEIWPDVLNLVRPAPRDNDPDTVWVDVDPDVLYPATFQYVMNRLMDETVPDPPLADLYNRAKGLRLHPRHITSLKCEDSFRLPPLERALRAELLTVLRLYFTEMLQRAIGGRIGIHITKDLRYRL